MSAKTHYFRIGLFVLTGAALLIGALFAVGLKAYFGKREIFETYVTGKVENLSVGALVTLRGVTIGKVSSIDFVGREYPQFKEQYVLIQFEVPNRTVWSSETADLQRTLDLEVAQGLRARVQGQGFLGANILVFKLRGLGFKPIRYRHLPFWAWGLTRNFIQHLLLWKYRLKMRTMVDLEKIIWRTSKVFVFGNGYNIVLATKPQDLTPRLSDHAEVEAPPHAEREQKQLV
jgi:hypothetical protein